MTMDQPKREIEPSGGSSNLIGGIGKWRQGGMWLSEERNVWKEETEIQGSV